MFLSQKFSNHRSASRKSLHPIALCSGSPDPLGTDHFEVCSRWVQLRRCFFLFLHVGSLVMRRFAVHCTVWLWRQSRKWFFEIDAWPRSFVVIGFFSWCGRSGTTCQAEACCRRSCVRTEQSSSAHSFALLVLCFCKERGDVSSQLDVFRRDTQRASTCVSIRWCPQHCPFYP